MNTVGVYNNDISCTDRKSDSVGKHRSRAFREAKNFDVFVPVSAVMRVSVLKNIFVKDDGDPRIRHSVFLKLAHDVPPMTRLCYVYTKCLIEKPMYTLYNKINRKAIEK